MSVRLFHLSDLHFGAEDARALDWFAATVRDERPDAIVVTGDLTMRARHREFRAAAAWLESLGRPMTIEPGNHDLPILDLPARFFAPYRRYDRLEAAIERPLGIAGVHVVPLRTTARFQWRLNWSLGHVGRSALGEALARLEAAPAGAATLVACHHPLIEAATRTRGGTRRGREALAALAAAGADAVLTGHVHDPFDIVQEVAGRQVRLIGAGTLSERVRDFPPSFNAIRVEGRAIDVTVRTMQ